MRLVIQRSAAASVTVDGTVVGSIDRGAVILLAVHQDDTEAEADFLAGKVSRLRIYDDADGKLNASIHESGGAFLVISQFTLYGDCRKGNRPSYIQSAPPDRAERLYGYFVEQLRGLGHHVETGQFQAAMQVALVNDGPVTLILERLHASS
jgi:D-aminoacyl-tRNA deacylase